MISVRPSKFGSTALILLALVLAGCWSTATTSPPTQATATATAIAAAVASTPSTPTPSATALVAPTAPPSPQATATTSTTLASRLAKEAMDFLTVFTQDFSPRASATLQENAAADFLAGEFRAIGYATELQEFTVSVTTSEVLVGPEAKEVQNVPLTLSGIGRASGPLVHVGEAREEDLPSEGLQG